MNYNKEEVMKAWREKFPRMEVSGSPDNEMRDVMQVFIEKQYEEIEDFLSTALDAAYKAGKEEQDKEMEKDKYDEAIKMVQVPHIK